MAILIVDPYMEDRLVAERRASGADRYDEVWEGVYMMTPVPNTEHQRIVGRLTSLLLEIIDLPGLGEVCPGVNLTRRDIKDWTQDFRVPDVAVLLYDGTGQDCDSHWRGAADFLVEVTSPGDKSREKIPFYSQLGVGEVLLVDRAPWSLELLRLQDGELKSIGRSTTEKSDVLHSTKVSLTFQLLPGEPRPRIQVEHAESGRSWTV